MFTNMDEKEILSLESKDNEDNICSIAIKSKPLDDYIKSNEQLLGSVPATNCPGLRTSARVIQKMKQDSIRPVTPPPQERKELIKDDKTLVKTPGQQKSAKIIWTNIERNLFFDALNEFGKDFEAIANFINLKIKRKNVSEQGFKSKEHVRQLYYQTFHKISKYIKFSDDVKKPAQELYALINYGEMRRKLVPVSDKNWIKIKDLVYKGYVTVRNKGKNIKIKTPSCKALRRLNQFEDWQEDIKLPSKVEIFLRPSNMESWGRVQSIAQNPLVRAVVPLQKKLVNILKTFQIRWRSQEVKLHYHALKMPVQSQLPTKNEIKTSNENEGIHYSEPLVCFSPQPDTVIHRPLLCFTELLSNFNISLNSYEDRIGATVRGEVLCHHIPSKRQRTDSGCEKKSPESKKIKSEDSNKIIINDVTKNFNNFNEDNCKCENVEKNDTDICNMNDCNDMLQDILSDDNVFKIDKQEIYNSHNTKTDTLLTTNNDNKNSPCKEPVDQQSDSLNVKSFNDVKNKKRDKKNTCIKRRDKKDNNFKLLLSEDVVKKIRNGWTILNSGDITIGDLYLTFGQESKLLLQYHWINNGEDSNLIKERTITPYCTNNNDKLNDKYLESIKSCNISNKLRHLLLIANLSDRMKKRICSCGHSCERGLKIKRAEGESFSKSYVSNKTYTSSHSDLGIFRQPVAPFRKTILSLETYKHVTNGIQNKPTALKPKSLMPKQVVVQRQLPIQPGLSQSYDVVSTQLQIKQTMNDSSTTMSLIENEENNVNLKENNRDKMVEFVESIINEENFGDNCEVDSILKSDKGINVNIEEKGEKNSMNSLSLEDEGINQLMEIPIPSPTPAINLDETFSNDSFSNIQSMSPMRIIREQSSDKWIEENFSDFSLSSFLGHLDEINRDINSDNTNISVISETSIDYMKKFADLTASMQNDDKDL